MKHIFRKTIAALCAGLMLCTAGVSTYAEEIQSELNAERRLPSGKTVSEFQFEMEAIYDFASAAVGIFQGNEIIYTGYFGKTDIENNIPADENSVYEWGSISKTLIWVSAMQLWEQGRIDLERDVREYLPEGFFKHLSYDEPITMMNLMNHNAGWQETTRPIFKNDENAILPLGEELQAIEPIQINRPGEVVAYSNYGAAVAGYVIECVTGQDYCEYVHENIFEPLGMEHTALNPAHSDNEWVYEQRKKMKSYKFTMGNCIDLGSCLNFVSAYPAGAATGTLSDMMTYGQALVNDDAPLFKSPETQKLLFSGTHFYGESDIPTCTHGFFCTEHSVRTYGHTGATTFGQANLELDLDSKTGLAVMVNEPNGNEYLAVTPIYTFGELSPDKYTSGSTEKTKLNGYYLQSRSTYCGMMKFIPYVSAISGKILGEAENIGNGVYQCRPEAQPESAVVIGIKTTSNGSIAFEQPSIEAVRDNFYLVKLCLLTVYVLLAIIAVYMLRIRHKLKKHGRWLAYSGQTAVTAGQTARIVSVILLLVTYVIYAQNMGGISYTACAVIGVMQMLCIVICGVSAIFSVAVILSKKENVKLFTNILNAVGSVLMITAVVYFEMYRFWEM